MTEITLLMPNWFLIILTMYLGLSAMAAVTSVVVTYLQYKLRKLRGK